MESAPVGAWAQDVTSPVKQSDAVMFLGGLPRWGRQRKFELSVDYVLPTALSGLVPIIFGFVVGIILVAALIVRMFPRRKIVDAQLHRVIAGPRRHLWQLPVSGGLMFLATLFVALGSVAIGVLTNALHDMVGVLSALLATVARAGLAVVDLFLMFAKSLRELKVDDRLTSMLPTPEGMDTRVIEAAFVAMRDYSVARMPDVQPLSNKLDDVIQRLDNLLSTADRYAALVYTVFLVLLLLQLLAPAAHFCVDVLYAHNWSVGWRFTLYLFYILVPAFTAWLLLGAASTVGILVADVCGVVHDYRDHLLGLPTAKKDNPIVATGFNCIASATAQGIKKQVDNAIAPLKEEIAGTAVQVILNRTSDDVLESAEWTANELASLVDCKTLIEVSGRLEYIMCGDQPHSAARGIADMWVAFLGLALVLGFGFLVSTVGVRTAWSTLVWPFTELGLLPETEDKDVENKMDDQIPDIVNPVDIERAEGNPADLDPGAEPVGLIALSLNEEVNTSPFGSQRDGNRAD